MVTVVKQRESIENFINFVGSFLVTEDATIREIELVGSNLNILMDRIQKIKAKKAIENVHCFLEEHWDYHSNPDLSKETIIDIREQSENIVNLCLRMERLVKK